MHADSPEGKAARSEKARKAGKARAAGAAAARDGLAAPVPLGTEAEIRASLEYLAGAAKAGTIPPPRIAAGIRAAEAAQALLAAGLEEKATEVRALIEELAELQRSSSNADEITEQ